MNQSKDDTKSIDIEKLWPAETPEETEERIAKELAVAGYKKYKCHKTVHAAKIKSIRKPGHLAEFPNAFTLYTEDDGLITVSRSWFDKHNPEEGGYVVNYEDGYMSYSPPGPFENGYTLMPDPYAERPEEAIEPILNALFTEDNTSVFTVHDWPAKTTMGCPYYEIVNSHTGAVFARIPFQQGPVKENGVNGIFMEDLLLIVLHRLGLYQEGPFNCRENALAITKIEEAVMWLRKRTLDRQLRGVEGTSEI